MTLQHTTLRHTTLHSSHDTTTTTATTLHWLHYTQLQLHYTTTTAALHHTNYIQQLWLQTLQPIQKTPLQQPFGPSVDSLCHPCIITTHLSYSVISLKLPPPPCAVLLVILPVNNRLCPNQILPKAIPLFGQTTGIFPLFNRSSEEPPTNPDMAKCRSCTTRMFMDLPNHHLNDWNKQA